MRGHAALGGAPAASRLANRKPEQRRAPTMLRPSYEDPERAVVMIRPGAQEALRRAAGSRFAEQEPDAPTVANELTHVGQQRQAGAPALAARGVIASEHDPAESEVEAVAA